MNQRFSSDRMAEAMTRARRHWQTRHQTASAELHLAPPPPPLTIAISRDAGANGSAIATEIGERLGWPVYDRELIHRIASEMGLRTDLLESVDEKHRGRWKEFINTLSVMPNSKLGSYNRHLVEILLSLAAHGNCIIVGRGAAQVLPEPTTLRVRLVGPVKARIEVVRQRRGISREEATRWVEMTDRERAGFVQEQFHKDPHDPSQYDVILNSTRFSKTECVDFIIEALHRLQAHVASTEPVAACT